MGGVALMAGSRVRLVPRPGSDIHGLVLSGQPATVECIERNLDNRLCLVVTLDIDPAREPERQQQQFGQRFCLSLGEVEPRLDAAQTAAPGAGEAPAGG